eukprot:SAG31_NODE_533_length_14371_cov_6.455367_11_plen_98_part_00
MQLMMERVRSAQNAAPAFGQLSLYDRGSQFLPRSHSKTTKPHKLLLTKRATKFWRLRSPVLHSHVLSIPLLSAAEPMAGDALLGHPQIGAYSQLNWS